MEERESNHGHWVEGCNWVPEYGGWMLEGTPSRPYAGYTTDLLRVERNMRLRRKRLLRLLLENEIAPTMSSFPLLGATSDQSVPPTKIGGPVTQSDYISDGIINPHPRFGTLSKNIRQRRGEKVNIRIPLYQDSNTPEYINNKNYNPQTQEICCDGIQVWRYGSSTPIPNNNNNDLVSVGCSKKTDTTDQKWEAYRIDVQCPGCRGLFYRSSPGNIVPDANWPRNGQIVYGYVVQPNWIKLQNGYYLPMTSDDGTVSFLQKLNSTSTTITNNDSRNNDEDDNLEEEEMNDSATSGNVKPAIHMDAMAFGMGCCCLQVTFQGSDMEESRYMYDQLAVLAPVLMALTAATPVMRGRLSDIDCRWGIISESVDDRTPAERGLPNDDSSTTTAIDYSRYAGEGKRRIPKSRYDSISTYIHPSGRMYNDIPLIMDDETFDECRKAGVDESLSRHISHLFLRDPLVMFQGSIRELNNSTDTQHFESIQSTNWQTVRWKPPPFATDIGWRTEFRSMEIQLTDFENAAFTVLIVLLTRVILSFDLNLYIPLSRIDANMQRAHSRNASQESKFFFRRHLAPLEEGDDGYGVTYSSMFARRKKNKQNNSNNIMEGEENSYEEMTMNEIMNGKGDYFPGLLPLIFAYLDTIPCDEDDTLRQYMEFISKRASGELLTPAAWMRQFLTSHPSYQQDSVVTEDMAYDLCQACHEIGTGKRHEPSLLGDVKIELINPQVGTYDVKLNSTRVNNEHLLDLLQRYAHRQPHSPQQQEQTQNDTSSSFIK